MAMEPRMGRIFRFVIVSAVLLLFCVNNVCGDVVSDTVKKILKFHAENFEYDRTPGAVSTFGSPKQVRCRNGTEVVQIAPANYLPASAASCKAVGVPTCGRGREELNWPQLVVYESVWIDGSGRAVTCSKFGHEAGGGIAPNAWPTFPTFIDDTNGMLNKANTTVYMPEVFSLTQHFASGPYRFLTEVLPKFFSVYLLLSKRNAYLLIPDSEDIATILTQLGEKSNHLVRIPVNQWMITSRAMYIAPTLHDGSNTESKQMDLDKHCSEETTHNILQDLFLTEEEREQPLNYIVFLTKIFRSDLDHDCSVNKCVKNGAELFDHVNKTHHRKYETMEVWPQDLRFERTVNIMNRAKVIVGVNGHGFGNILMMRAGAGILNINYMYERKFFYPLAERRNIKVEAVNVFDDDAHGEGMVVDVKAVASKLKRLL